MILYEKRGLGGRSRVGLSCGRVGTAWQPSLPFLSSSVSRSPFAFKIRTLYSVICTPLGQHAVLTLPKAEAATPVAR